MQGGREEGWNDLIRSRELRVVLLVRSAAGPGHAVTDKGGKATRSHGFSLHSCKTESCRGTSKGF